MGGVTAPRRARHSSGSVTERLAGRSDRALSVVTRDGGGGRAELTSVAATLEEAKFWLSVARGAQVPIPTEASRPRDEVRAAVAPSAER